MKVEILKEEGYDLALRGMSYSFRDRAQDVESWWDGQRPRAISRAAKLAPMGGGHNKFLRQVQLWIDVEAARAWWSEFDTYKVGVVANSESTMHRLAKRPPTFDDFEEGTLRTTVLEFIRVWNYHKDDINILKMNLPEGFLQRRMVTMNYENLRNVIAQRKGHRLKWWGVFIDEIAAQIEHPELIQDLL